MSERQTKTKTETECDANGIRGGVRTQGIPGGHVCEPIGTAEKPPPEPHMYIRRNPVQMSSGVMSHSEATTKRACMHCKAHTDEKQERRSDQSGAGTIAVPIEDGMVGRNDRLKRLWRQGR